MNTKPLVSRQLVVAFGLLTAVALVATLGSLATIPNVEGWYADANKVPWNPPNAVFGPAWSVLYVLMALAGWLIWRSGWREGKPSAARGVLTLFAVQLILNGLWTPIFFAGYPLIGVPAWWIALVVIVTLIVTVIWLMGASWKFSKWAALLLLPYVLWLIFASTLNAGIIALN